MQISDLLGDKGTFVATTAPDTAVAAAARELARHRIGALVVSRDGSSILGIVSERDIVRAVGEYGEVALGIPVETIMSKPVRTCAPTDDVETLMATMTEHRIRHLPVLVDGRLAGIVSIGDLVKSRIDELERDREALERYIDAR